MRIDTIGVIIIAVIYAAGMLVIESMWQNEVSEYRAALIQADKNYRAALREDTELQICREALETVLLMEAL